MGQMFTLFIVLVALFLIVHKLRQSSAETERRAEAEEKDKRQALEKDILNRLGRIREKQSEVELAKDAVKRDPKRAAKVVSNMLKDKEPAKKGKDMGKR